MQDLLKKDQLQVGSFEKREGFLPHLETINADFPQHTSLKTHLISHAFHTICDMEIPADIRELNYPRLQPAQIDLKKFSFLDSPYVVLAPMFTSRTRALDPALTSELLKHVRSKGLKSVYLGSLVIPTGRTKSSAILTASKRLPKPDYDLVNQTSLLEAAALMGQAKAVIGIDNGLLHLAATTDVPIIAGFTNVRPELRTPIRRSTLGWRYFAIGPSPELACRYCQSAWHFVQGWRFTQCFYDDFKCTKSLDPKIFTDFLDLVLEGLL
jgi:ADP-heptose:LPS heptosyltransferase